MALWNVYRWEHRAGRQGRAVRIWQGEAKGGREALLSAYAARPQHRRKNLIVRRAQADSYADDPTTVIEHDDGRYAPSQ